MKNKLLLTTALVSVAFAASAASAAADMTPLVGDFTKVEKQSIVNAGVTATGTDLEVKGQENDSFGAVNVQRLKEEGQPDKNGTLNLKGGSFTSNSNKKGDGGAVASYGNLNIDGTTFLGNKDHHGKEQNDDTAIGGGAIALGVDGVTDIKNATFDSNISWFRGGAIATRRTLQNNENGTIGSLTITDSTFKGNIAFAGVKAKDATAGLGGAIATNFNNTTITGGEFTRNFAQNGGGAIYLTGYLGPDGKTAVAEDERRGGNLTISGTKFTGNSTFNQGGAILSGTSSQQLTITDADFDNNAATYGGGAIWSGSETHITNGTFTNNKVFGATHTNFENDWQSGQTEGGGAIFVGSSSNVVIDGHTTFANNASGTVGGAIATRGNSDGTESSLSISGADFTNNSAKIAGGAISIGSVNEKNVEINNSTFTGNTSALGGALYNRGTATLTGGSFSGNEALVSGDDKGHGGAILNSGGTLNLTDVAFSGNHSSHGGGAVYGNKEGKITVTNGSFDDNIAGYTKVGEDAKEKEAKKGGNGGAIFAGEGTTLTVDGTTFSGNQAIGSGESGWGGAISSAASTATVTGATFTANSATVAGGAINVTDKGKMDVSNGIFTSNSSANGGAIYSKGTLGVIGGEFTGNEATAGGGAILNSGGTLEIKSDETTGNVRFADNTSEGPGGAIYNNSGNLTIDGADFENNTGRTGGAVSSTTKAEKHSATIENATFTGNKAVKDDKGVGGNGGALSVTGTTTLENITFSNNTADVNGGALNITGEEKDTVTLAGDIVFENNTANGKKNDINFDKDGGSITLKDDTNLTLDGGISCTTGTCSKATVKMGKDSVLNIHDDTRIAAKIVSPDSEQTKDDSFGINLKLKAGTNSFDLGDIFTAGNASELKDNLITENKLFEYVTDDDSTEYTVEEKSASEVAANLGVSGTEAETVLGIMRGASDNENFQKVQEVLGDMAQSDEVDSELMSRSADALGADAAPVVRTRETMLSNMIFDAANDALDDNASALVVGQASGDSVFEKAKIWIKGLFNSADKDDTDKAHGFDIDTYGVAMGADKEIGAGKVGLGYAYSKSDINGYTRDTDVKTHTAFVYGQYQPANWYLKGVAAYSWSDYEEKKSVLGYNAKAKYDVDTLALEGLYGYNLHVANGLDVTPEAGLRYVSASQDSYTNALGVRVQGNDIDVLTAVAGVKVAKDFAVSDSVTIRPELRAALTYDLRADDNDSIVTIPGGATYRLNGEKLERFGYELGAKLATDITSDWEVSAGYEGRFRKDYNDHSGIISAKYKF